MDSVPVLQLFPDSKDSQLSLLFHLKDTKDDQITFYLFSPSCIHSLSLTLWGFRKDKEKARKIQDANRKRKEEEKEKLRGKALAGARRKQVSFAEKDDADVGGDDADDDDDAEWYRKEVGTEPEKGPPLSRHSLDSIDPSLFSLFSVLYFFLSPDTLSQRFSVVHELSSCLGKVSIGYER